MATFLDLTVDLQNKKLYVNNAAASVIAALAFTRQDYVQLRIQPVKRNLVGGLRSQIEIVDVTPLTLQVAAGPWNDPYAQQLTWTRDETNNWFTASLNFNTTELETAFTSDPDYIDTNIQFRFIEDGQPVSVIVPCRILNSIIQTGSPAPEEIDPPSALVAALALIFADSADIDVQQSGNTFLFVLKDAGRPSYRIAASQVAMLALSAVKGDWCRRTDTNTFWMLTTANPTQLANWQEAPGGFDWQGAWSSATTYAVDAGVSKNGSSYISIQAGNLNHDPADPANIGVWWDVLAAGSTIQLATAPDAVPSEIVARAASAIGTHARAAREDHEHKSLVATPTVSGLHSAADKRRFDMSLGPYIGGFNAAASAIFVDGETILIAGDFTLYSNTAAPKIVAFNKHGLPLPGFDWTTGFSAAPSFISKASDGDYLFGASAKISYRGAAAAWIHKIAADGTPDAAFTSPATLAAVGGDQMFCLIGLSNATIVALTWQTVRVLDLTGATVSYYTSDPNIHHLSKHPGSDAMMLSMRATTSGVALEYDGVGNPRGLKLLDAAGSINADWITNAGTGADTGCGSSVWSPDGSFIIASSGGLSHQDGTPGYTWKGGAAIHKGLYKVMSTGSEDASWNPNIILTSESAASLIPQCIDSQNRVYFTGTNITSVGGTAVTAGRLYRVNSDGTGLKEVVDFNGTVYAARAIDDEHIVVVGAFTAYGSVPVGYLVFIDADGNLLPTLDRACTDHQTITVTAAGTSRITPRHQGILSLLVDVNDTYGGGGFTHTLKLPEFGATEGDRVRAVFDLPASTDPTLTVEADDGSTILSFTSLSFASILEVDFVFKGGAWVAEVPRWTNAAGAPAQNAYVLGTTTYGASVGVDLDGPAYQQITATGALELSTLAASRAGSGEAKSVTLFITASGGDRAITFATGIKGIGDTLPSGKTAAVCLLSRGANESDTLAAYAQLD